MTWSDTSLYGNCLTSLPGKQWDFATSEDLVTYEKPDPGSAERIFLIFEKYTKTERYSNGNVKRQTAGTNSLLFKYAEICFRAVVGTCLAAGATLILAPLGFALKIIHKAM